jgi:hypothetical protein
MVTIPRARRHSDGEGNITDESYGGRLERLGRLVVEMSERLSSGVRGAEVLGAAV